MHVSVYACMPTHMCMSTEWHTMYGYAQHTTRYTSETIAKSQYLPTCAGEQDRYAFQIDTALMGLLERMRIHGMFHT